MARLSALLLLPVTASAALVPSAFHLALAGEGEMRVSYSYNTSLPSTCTYAANASAPLTSGPATVRSYFPGLGYTHHVLLQGLAPSTPYTYACAGGPQFSFVSAPPPATFSPFNFAVFGDWGYLGSKERGPSIPAGGLSTNWSAVPVRELLEGLKNNHSIDLILHTGALPLI